MTSFYVMSPLGTLNFVAFVVGNDLKFHGFSREDSKIQIMSSLRNENVNPHQMVFFHVVF